MGREREGEGFFLNCIKPCFARTNVVDLCGEVDELAHAGAAAIQMGEHSEREHKVRR